MSFFIASAVAQTEAAAPQGNPMITLLMFGGMFLFMYLLIIRPQRKRQKEHQNLVAALAKGDEVVMTSGMLGKVIKVDENYIVLETGNNVELKFQKVAVHAVLPKGTIKTIESA
ncbi:preprotein translocase subunit YajC [Cellvibrio fontiphilus]|uniref:Sec translocon accessory complex subunit YajC n=1 Tax=Cellvibrio fontiphilus TaxID=1815559 RepID=A0ABV7FEQ0_9GAMM|nr:preprotein translocase subunit YajC [Cellvibrio fontiphilus]